MTDGKPAHEIIDEVCLKHGIDREHVKSSSRSRCLSAVRWEIAQRLRAERGMKNGEIGLMIGGVDERAVAYMVDPAQRAIKRERHLATYVRKIATDTRPRSADGRFEEAGRA